MPVGQQFDLVLDGKGFMLERPALYLAQGYQGRARPRAYHRTGQPNAVQPRSTDADLQRNALPPEVDFVAAYEDFSGGYGDAYRDPSTPNRIHWAENMEVRFPRQAVHAQAPQDVRFLINDTTVEGSIGNPGGWGNGVAWVTQVPNPAQAAGLETGPAGRGAVLLLGDYSEQTVGSATMAVSGYVAAYEPTGLLGFAFGADAKFHRTVELGLEGSAYSSFFGRAALWGSFLWAGANPRGIQPQFRRRDLRGVPGTSMTLGPLNGAVFTPAGNRLWRAHGPSGGHINLLQSVGPGADPMATANWGPTFNIGNGLVDVQDMLALNDQVFASTQDGLYAGDTTGTFFNVLGNVVSQVHPDNGRQIAIHEGALIYPHRSGLTLYQQLSNGAAVSTDISPVQSSLRSPLRGYIRAVTSYGGWLYGGLFNGTQSYLVTGRQNGNGKYDWHPLQRLPDIGFSGQQLTPVGPIKQILVDAISTPSGGGTAASGNLLLTPRVWVITEASSRIAVQNMAFMWPIPNADANPIGVSSFSANYNGSASMYFGRDNRGAPETKKLLRRIDVNTDASTMLSGSRYCDVFYALDGGGRTLLGRAQQSPRTTLFFPVNNGSFVTCFDFELSVDSFANVTNFGQTLTDTCPVYRSFILHGAFLSEGMDEITAVLDTADKRADRMGVPMRSAAAQIGELRAMAGGPPVRLIDLTGAQNWVTVNRNIDEMEQYQEGQGDPEVIAVVRMTVLPFS